MHVTAEEARAAAAAGGGAAAAEAEGREGAAAAREPLLGPAVTGARTGLAAQLSAFWRGVLAACLRSWACIRGESKQEEERWLRGAFALAAGAQLF